MDRDALVGNAADARQVREARKSEKRKRKEHLEDVRAILAMDAGKRVLWGILDRAGVYACNFHENPSLMSFREGKRDMGLWLMADIVAADAGALLGMMKDRLPKEDLDKDEKEEPKDE